MKARIEMGDAPEQAKKLAAARHRSDNMERYNEAVNLVNKAVELCFNSAKTNVEISHEIGVTRRQASRLRHGSKAAWERLV